MSWTVIVISACTLLSVLMIWKEYQRPTRSRLIWRVLATLSVFAALACIALPISYNSPIKTGTNNAILLTLGFDRDSLTKYQNSKLFTADIAIQKANPKLKIKFIPDLSDLPQGKLNIASLQVLGYGLNGDELEQLNNFPILFHPAAHQPGITSIDWARHLKTGESLQIQGKFTGNTSKINLVLKGLNTSLDSATINPDANFELKAIPKNSGRATYALLAIDGKDTLERETISFEVEPKQTIKVLMLATSPDFENRFLKNWLARQEYGVTVRTAVSQAKFSREYFNMPQVNTDHVNSSLLDKFDLVIGDLSAFKSLSPAENSTLQQAVQNGLGIIAKADSSKGASFLSNTFVVERPSGKEPKASALLIDGQTSPTAKLLSDAAYINPQANARPLITNDQNQIVANSTIYGGGKIIFSLLSNTYSWALAGNQNDYTNLWSKLIEKVSRKAILSQKWHTFPQLPVVNEPCTITIAGPAGLPLLVKAETSPLAFKQNPLLPFSWDATYWPANGGWQQLTQNGAAIYWWYVFKPGDWAILHAFEKASATQKYALQNHGKAVNNTPQLQNIRVSMSKIYFYLLLLLCCTYLWVEGKL